MSMYVDAPARALPSRPPTPWRRTGAGTQVRAAAARWGRTCAAGLAPAAWVLGAPIDLRAVARRPS